MWVRLDNYPFLPSAICDIVGALFATLQTHRIWKTKQSRGKRSICVVIPCLDSDSNLGPQHSRRVTYKCATTPRNCQHHQETFQGFHLAWNKLIQTQPTTFSLLRAACTCFSPPSRRILCGQYRSPVSTIIHTEVTVNVGLKNKLRVGASIP